LLGAQRFDLFFNRIQSCKFAQRTAVANNLEPFAYIKYLLTELPKLGRHYEPEALDAYSE
jgi:hypothetical protein